VSETLTLTSGSTGLTYGTLALATTYLDGAIGDVYVAWGNLEPDDQKRTLISATRYLDRQAWNATAESFALRDAIAAFPLACYELAALAGSDPSVLVALDQGSNIASVGAGGASVTYFNPTSARFGSAATLPPVAQAMVGGYLATAATSGPRGGYGLAGADENPFDESSDYDVTGV
jgi:hypothetical protein